MKIRRESYGLVSHRRFRRYSLHAGTVNLNRCRSPEHFYRQNQPRRTSFANEHALDSRERTLIHANTVPLFYVRVRFHRICTGDRSSDGFDLMTWNQRRQVCEAYDRTDSRCRNYLHASFGNIGHKQITGKECFPYFLLAVLPLANPRERREKSLKTFVVKDLVCKVFMLVPGLNCTPLFLSTRVRVVQADALCVHKASPFDSHWLFARFVSPVQLDRY